MKLAIVHDYLNQYGEAERVLEAVHEIWPDAPIYTLLHNPKNLPGKFKEFSITPTFAQRLPFVNTQYEKYFLVYPTAIEQFNFESYDVVLSISSAWAKGVITTPDTIHISYILDPMRFAWQEYHERIERTKRTPLRVAMSFIMNYIRLWDTIAGQRPDSIITLSETVKRRILKYYRRESTVIYPPCDTDFFTPNPNLKVQDFFLMVGRFKAYKHFEIAVEAFNEIDLPLLIIGEGEMRAKLEKIARTNIQFLGKISDEQLLSYYRRAQALIFPTLEDFGIVPVEAQACGTPVIAFKGGGAIETVIENKTGKFFFPQTKAALIDTVKKFDRSKFNPAVSRKNSLEFSKQIFKKKILDFVERKCAGQL